MGKKLAILLFCIALAAGALLPRTVTRAASATITVAADSVNVRSGPDLSTPLIKQLKRGERYPVVKEEGDWIEISFPDGTEGWVVKWLVSINGRVTSAGATGKITATSLSVRQNPSLNGKIIGTVQMGQSFTILEEKNNWDKIEYLPGLYGWVSEWYLEKTTTLTTDSGQARDAKMITILHNGTNIRNSPDVQADVLAISNAGETFQVIRIEKDWYQIKLKNGSSGFVAGWLVTINGNEPGVEKPGAGALLSNKTIVVDPGHGGVDHGTTGAGGTLEKNLTLRTARLLFDKLKAAGANVILTRNNDSYISLPSRVYTSTANGADAFVSLHYDSNDNRSVHGMTGYYYYPYQKSLANYLYTSTINQTKLWNRGVRFGNYHVIRENPQRATLIELGYLSNPEEEIILNSSQFQENATLGIFNGLARYFNND